jgi:hypothetical protein
MQGRDWHLLSMGIRAGWKCIGSFSHVSIGYLFPFLVGKVMLEGFEVMISTMMMFHFRLYDLQRHF